MKAKKVLSFFLAALMGAGIAGIPAAAIDTDSVSGTEYTVQYEYPRMPEGYSIQKNIEDILSEYLSDEKAASYFTNDIQLYSSDYTSNYLFYVKQRCGSDANYKTMDKAADNVIAMMDKNWSDMTKVVFLNDYFTSTKKYDLTYTKYSAYNLLVENTAVCQGYAEAFWYIMYKLGIDCKLVSSDSLNHAWNLVKIDNSWYHIDTTWNDPVPDVEGSSHHDFLLLSDTEMGLTNHNATDWVLPYENNASAFNYAVSTKYDSYFWKNTTTPIIIKNNRFYYRHDKNIMSADANNNTQTIRATGSGNWSVWGSSNSYWAGDFGSLVNSGNYLIYNTPTSIMYCDLNGNNAAALYSLSKSELSEGYIYGLFVDGSTLRYRLATAPQYTSYKDHTLTLPFAAPVTPKLTVTVGDSRAFLSWGAVSNATRYRTFYRLTGTSAWTSSGDIKSTSNTITGLSNGRQYDFLVLAGNNSTFSAWNNSDIVKAVPQKAAAVPVTPKLTVTAGDSRAVLSWGAVSNATRYRTFYRLTGTSAWTSSGDIKSTSNTITGLSNGRQYDFLVLAGNNSTFSAWSNSDIVKAVPQKAAAVPVTPKLTVTAGDSRAVLSWGAVSNATRYRTFYRLTGTSAWTSSGDIRTTSNTITGLTNGKQYDFLVLAGNNSTFSAWNNSNIVRAVPQGSSSVPVTPKLTVTAGDSRAVLSWGAVSNATRYRTFYRLTGTSAWTSSGDIRTTSNTITGLTNGKQYDFLVLAGNNSTFSSWNNSNIVRAVPQAAAAVPVTPKLTVTAGDSRAVLSWGAVSNATRYRTFYRLTGTSAWTSSGDIRTTSNTITGLTNGRQYDFLVLAGNNSTFSAWSNSDIVKAVPQAAAVVPVTPELTVAVSSGRADLSWNAVPNATRYRAFCRPTGTSAWSSSNDMTSTSCIISGLTNGQQYDFLVLAGNSTTFSSWNNSDIVRVYIG